MSEKELKDALKNRDDAARMWSGIAAGEVSDEKALEWVREVASRIKKLVLDVKFISPNRRADASQRAIGLVGRPDEHRALRADLELLKETWGDKPIGRRETVEILQLVADHFTGMKIENAMKLHDRAKKKKKG